jgi:PAS domain-containing protein
MMSAEIDYMAIFHCLPVPIMVMTPDKVITDVNRAYCEISGRARAELIGRSVFDAFPDNPSEPGSTGSANLNASLTRVSETGECDVMALQRYDTEAADSPGEFTERYWCPVNAPVFGTGGEVAMLVHIVEEVPELIRRFVDAEAANA